MMVELILSAVLAPGKLMRSLFFDAELKVYVRILWNVLDDHETMDLWRPGPTYQVFLSL